MPVLLVGTVGDLDLEVGSAVTIDTLNDPVRLEVRGVLDAFPGAGTGPPTFVVPADSFFASQFNNDPRLRPAPAPPATARSSSRPTCGRPRRPGAAETLARTASTPDPTGTLAAERATPVYVAAAQARRYQIALGLVFGVVGLAAVALAAVRLARRSPAADRMLAWAGAGRHAPGRARVLEVAVVLALSAVLASVALLALRPLAHILLEPGDGRTPAAAAPPAGVGPARRGGLAARGGPGRRWSAWRSRPSRSRRWRCSVARTDDSLSATRSAAGPTATCSGLVRIYPTATGETHALRGVDAEFHEHTVTALTGPSGSGKSTLLALLALRDRPSGGDVTILGRNASSLRTRERRAHSRRVIAWVPQRPTDGVYPHLTAAQNVEQAARWRGASPDAERGLLERLGLEQVAGVAASRLSGGEQQRVALACACVGAPRLILCDEPTAELDEDTAALVMRELRTVAAGGSAVVIATHDPGAIAASDRVVALRHGVMSTEQWGATTARATIDPAGPGAAATGRPRALPEPAGRHPHSTATASCSSRPGGVMSDVVREVAGAGGRPREVPPWWSPRDARRARTRHPDPVRRVDVGHAGRGGGDRGAFRVGQVDPLPADRRAGGPRPGTGPRRGRGGGIGARLGPAGAAPAAARPAGRADGRGEREPALLGAGAARRGPSCWRPSTSRTSPTT